MREEGGWAREEGWKEGIREKGGYVMCIDAYRCGSVMLCFFVWFCLVELSYLWWEATGGLLATGETGTTVTPNMVCVWRGGGGGERGQRGVASVEE